VAAPVVTALHSRGSRRERVAVELEGRPWRILPLEAALAAGLDVGVELDRPRARRLAQELRRLKARSAALRALRSRDHTTESLRRRLEARGVAPRQLEQTVETLTRAGLVDDRRFAMSRAATLAARGAGDLKIRYDLESRGVSLDLVGDAVAALEPERERAQRLVAAHGATPKVLRRLVANGFAAANVEDLVADEPDAELRYEGFI
jgi:SOS response regulatory protein OraA/RecX